MSEFSDMFDSAEDVIDSVMGDSYSYKPKLSAPITIIGVRKTGNQEEGVVAGDSTNLQMSVRLDQFDEVPAAGDEVTIGTGIYKVVGDPEIDDLDLRALLKLTRDRDVIP